MANLLYSILQYNTEVNKLSRLDLNELAIQGSGDFSDIYDATHNITQLKYLSIDDTEEMSPLYDLADYVTKKSENMTSVVMSNANLEAT